MNYKPLIAGLMIAALSGSLCANALPLLDDTTGQETTARTGSKIATPAELVGGNWSWTTISSIGYRDTITKQLAEPSGMSARFSFTKDGRYQYFFYIRQRTYNLVTEATTTEEGKVEFRDNGTFILHTTKGHYKGSTGSRKIDRDMTAEERKDKTYYWEWREEDGKRKLYIGPTKKSFSHFKRGE